ncbi:upstream stimulatory factor 1-like [Anarrhichthys ocellatus]|uniref:upstream stimulatory factor 1-like n=1 Tax=Anarrhichthys ocellatus TaxID=433405 RepID=UPI0012EE6E66|nr:upstream stimulatory factor 1-like [Anarrhichthys ocellatus]
MRLVQVTYRVIQVSDGQLDGQTDAAVSLVTGFPATSQTVTQAVFSQPDGLESDGGGAETQYTYYPATIADAATGTMVTTVQASDTLLGQTTPTGKYRRDTETRAEDYAVMFSTRKK